MVEQGKEEISWNFLIKLVRCAAINAATLALINAGIPMKDFVVSCAAGCIDGTTPILG